MDGKGFCFGILDAEKVMMKCQNLIGKVMLVFSGQKVPLKHSGRISNRICMEII